VKYFTPPEKTSATIPNNETDKNTNTYMLQNSDGKLFPIGQDGYFGCGSGYSGKDKDYCITQLLDNLIHSFSYCPALPQDAGANNLT